MEVVVIGSLSEAESVMLAGIREDLEHLFEVMKARGMKGFDGTIVLSTGEPPAEPKSEEFIPEMMEHFFGHSKMKYTQPEWPFIEKPLSYQAQQRLIPKPFRLRRRGIR